MGLKTVLSGSDFSNTGVQNAQAPPSHKLPGSTTTARRLYGCTRVYAPHSEVLCCGCELSEVGPPAVVSTM